MSQNWKASKWWVKKQVVREQQEFNTHIPSYDILVAESVDEDADATFKDNLILLASYGDGGTWRKELDKLLQAEHQEQEEMKKECMPHSRRRLFDPHPPPLAFLNGRTNHHHLISHTLFTPSFTVTIRFHSRS
ncbi:hypothetical protein PILCRDRAFT_8025 [Piloderma croceum F 1598]|uniref:Uncharacterized protein n=1 Tax=Piloderma croceum (strain F 1598) TaxID=765440 RepID=A0A0C3BXV3_PILCF|nr:hypothetical protein PILCRDRAFT_8025 [Piloderma croceum F 1598]